MTGQPLFLTLPMLVVEKIIKYLEGRPRGSFDEDIDYQNEMKKVLYPLLSIGEIWYEAVLVSICDSCKIVFDDAHGVFKIYFPAWPEGFSYTGFHNYNLVKRVVMVAPSWEDVCDKDASETIAWSRYNGAIFPSATTLVVKLIKSSSLSRHTTAKLDPKANHNEIVSLARSIRRLTPAVTRLSVVAISADTRGKPCRALCVMLVSALCRESVTRLDVSCQVDSPILLLRLYDVSRLTTITHGAHIPCSPIAWLAYLNASTLRELHIVPTVRDDWDSLICYGNKTHASYTSLVSLSMDITETFSAQSWTTVEGSIPFPSLAKLTVFGVYPIDDDTLFRGNHGTLRNLSLPVDAIAKNALGGFNVLNYSATPMNSIHITPTTSGHRPITSDSLVQEQVHRILRSSMTLQLYCGIPTCDVFKALCTAPRTAIIQHLILFNQSCAIDNIISIVSALPSLVSLTTEIHGSATRIGLIPENEHPSVLHEKYYPLSIKFRVLRILGAEYTNIGKVSILAMQIAVICPTFAYVDIPPEERREFRGKVAWSSKNGPFKPYGAALRRLI
ncbi:hypothetical protein GGH13_002122 [Coemansia sp. S155-1]|nr:hypothetical protein GGH13_002122 [Coemansia sp. S155-1]